MGDPRVWNVDQFTTTQHHQVPDYLDPSKTRLPGGYTACIVGASAGIGEHIAYALATAHASTLILCARDTTKLDRVANHILTTIRPNDDSIVIHIHECDISSPTSILTLSTFIRTQILDPSPDSRLDALIPVAAYAPPITGMKITQNDPEEVRKAFDTNVLGVYTLAHYFVPMLLEKQKEGRGLGQFFVIGSIAACITKGMIANTGYTISKMAQVRLVEYLDVQFGREAVRAEAAEAAEAAAAAAAAAATEGDKYSTAETTSVSNEGLLALAIHPGSVMTDMARGNTPERFIPALIDDVGLCGAMVVWLAGARRNEVEWLGGRLISANWDVKELMQKRRDVVEKDLLKFELVTS